jgi:cytochrome oxidase Cu insertion factor (SCO1/SenC/PrrC family)
MRRAVAVWLTLLFVASCGRDREPRYGLPLIDDLAAPPIASGAFELSHLHGDVVALTFGYTRCGARCDAILESWRRVRHELGSDASRAHFLFISIDWRHDTDSLVARHLATVDPDIRWVILDSSARARVERDWDLTFVADSMTQRDESALTTPSQTYLVDARGMLRAVYPWGATSPRQLASDIRRVLGTDRMRPETASASH